MIQDQPIDQGVVGLAPAQGHKPSDTASRAARALHIPVAPKLTRRRSLASHTTAA